MSGHIGISKWGTLISMMYCSSNRAIEIRVQRGLSWADKQAYSHYKGTPTDFKALIFLGCTGDQRGNDHAYKTPVVMWKMLSAVVSMCK